jgi:hypothetical protein
MLEKLVAAFRNAMRHLSDSFSSGAARPMARKWASTRRERAKTTAATSRPISIFGTRISPGWHPDDDVERAGAAVDRHWLRALSQPECREEARDAEHVVEVAMRQQNPVEASEAGRRSGAIAAASPRRVDQDAMASELDKEARMVAFG